MITTKRSLVRQGVVLIVLLLFLNLPIVSALEISNVRAEEVTGNSAAIRWETDEPANSFVEYGTSAASLVRRGDAALVTSHRLAADSLVQDTAYLYKVESGGVIADNSGELYLFRTLPPDTQAPELRVELPEIVAGNRVNIAIVTEPAAEVSLFVNGPLDQRLTSDSSGNLSFRNVVLRSDQMNTIHIEAKDAAGNMGVFDGAVYADSKGPILQLSNLSSVVDQRRISINGTVSENSTVELFLNNRSVKRFLGVTVFEHEVNLEEGRNDLSILAVDKAGWHDEKKLVIEADTEKPQVEFTLVSGTEYYEGRAETEIVGTTKPGALAFLYVFQEGLSRHGADFSKALDVVNATETGEFRFASVHFPPPSQLTLKKIGPREVPPGLEDILISPLSQLQQEQRKSYAIYIIVEDQLGRVNFAQQKVNIYSCFSGGAFEINPIVDFQAPFRLDPTLMEEGRESIQAVFNLTYRGNSLGFTNPQTGQAEESFRIIGPPKVQRACTQNQVSSDDYALGCKLLPPSLRVVPNQDRTAIYVTADLNRASEFLDKEENVWNDFQKRQLKLPIKISFSYAERQAYGDDGSRGGWSPAKTEQFCYDLTYFVDIPIDSADMVPDFLIEDVVPALNDTVVVIETVQSYLQYAMIATGVGCIGSWFSRMATRLYRIFISNYEPWLTKGNDDDEPECPELPAQNNYYLDDTITNWKKLEDNNHASLLPSSTSSSGGSPSLIHKLPDKYWERSLDTVCPKTADAWGMETYLDWFFRATCDRFFCREVPAGWTAEAEKKDVDEVIQEQKQCTATANGLYLDKMENCDEFVSRVPAKRSQATLIKTKGNVCYRDAEGFLYYVNQNDPGQADLNKRNIWRLEFLDEVGDIGRKVKPKLLAYKPPQAQNFMVAPDTQCKDICKEAGYGPIGDAYKQNDDFSYTENKEGTCYQQITRTGALAAAEGSDIGFLKPGSSERVKMDSGLFPAGYTNDCFADIQGNLYQCICDSKRPDKDLTVKGRTAVKKIGKVEESWEYREATVYDESFGVSGTYYPPWRYYSGRDFTGAFGFDLGFDNFRDFKVDASGAVLKNDKTSSTVNPNTDTLATFQSMCLPGINARLEVLKSILNGIKNCLIEAKTTGLQDAGMCKTIFTQYVCSLIYKGLSMFVNQCSPISLGDASFGIGNNPLTAAFDSGIKAIPQAMSSSISDLKGTYKNANLEQYFASGVQGFAESMCLAAFGFDFPMGIDWIMDTAYSFPMATSVLFPIASRELATFNPIKGTATFRYNLGGTILPGCNIRGYRTYLKCIGPEDLNKPNVECSDEGCDCLQASNFETPFAGERTHVIQEGTSFTGLPRHKGFELPIPSPQMVSKNFRYDHVVIELTLDQGESPETCFDDGYRTPNGGQFYFPISPIKTPFGAKCYVDGTSGRFICPEIGDFFGGGQTYFEHPFLRCYDKDTEEFTKCSTENLFLLTNPATSQPDNIVVKPYINLEGQPACLKVSSGDRLIEQLVTIPEGVNGPFSPTIDLGAVRPEMVAGGASASIVRSSGSNFACGGQNGALTIRGYPTSDQARSRTVMEFTYTKNTDGTFKLKVHPGVRPIAGSGYSLTPTSFLSITSKEDLSREEINRAEFEFEGFIFSNVLGSADVAAGATTPTGSCSYAVNPGSASFAVGMGSISLKLELYQMPPNGGCGKLNTLFPKGAFGGPTHTERLTVQREASEVTQSAGIHRDFLEKRWQQVISKATSIVNRDEATMEDAKALYYYAAALVMSNADASQVQNILQIFFQRAYITDTSDTVSAIMDIRGKPEFKKICQYMTQMNTAYPSVPPLSGTCPP